MTDLPVAAQALTTTQRYVVLLAAFLGWLLAGLEIALFVLIHRQAMISLTSVPIADGAVGIAGGINEDAIKYWFALYQAAFLFGAAVGGWVFGLIGDRYGRTQSLAWSILCYSLFTGLCYWAHTPTELLILRFLACHGIGGAWPNTVALVSEAWPNASRPFLAGLLGTAANIGQVSMGALGLWSEVTVDSWRWVLLVGATPAIIGLWCLRGVPESRMWLASRHRLRPHNGGPLRELFRPPLRSRTIVGILVGAVPVVGTAANAQWIVPWADQVTAQVQHTAAEPTTSSPSRGTPVGTPPAALQIRPSAAPPVMPTVVPTNSSDDRPSDGPPVKGKANPKAKAWTIVTRSGGAVFGSLLGGFLATLLGRKVTYFLISLLSFLASSLIFGWLHPLHPWFTWATFALGFVGTIYFGWLPLYLPELFPTHVRATGTGIAFNTGRIVAGCVALGTSVLLGIVGGNYARIGYWTGMIYVVGMVIILLAPKTDDTEMKAN